MAVSRTLQSRNVDLRHLHHGLHDSTGFGGIGVGHQLWQQAGDDLPCETVLVLEPRASALRASFGELLPQLIDADDENGLQRVKKRSAI